MNQERIALNGVKKERATEETDWSRREAKKRRRIKESARARQEWDPRRKLYTTENALGT